MVPLCFTEHRSAYELNPAAIDRIEPWMPPGAYTRHNGYRITFAGGGVMQVRTDEAVESIGEWLNRSGFPLTETAKTEPDEAEAEPVNG